jgi:CelD/BcsL family acetyltransferase involved in cellulose biosynthesis
MRPTQFEVDVRETSGPAALDDLGAAYDELAARLDLPLTSRRPWLTCWTRAYPTLVPWAVTAWEGSDLVGACLLARRRLGTGIEIVSLGHGRNDRTRLLAHDDHVAAALATTIAHCLETVGRPWSLRVEQVPTDDPVAAGVAAALPGAWLMPGGSVPGVAFVSGRSVGPYLSKNLRRQLQKSTNRIATDGFEVVMAFTQAEGQLRILVDEIEQIHRTRDHDVGRTSDIDDAAGRHLWRSTIGSHIGRGIVEIATLRLDGALAAYVVSFLDGDTYRVFDGRFVTGWARYSPGRLLEVETLARALGDERFGRLDWMNSVAPDKLIAANTLEPTMHLVGSQVA